MTEDEENCIKVLIPGQPIIEPSRPPLTLSPIDLQNIGYLKKISTYIMCPSCLAETMSVVRLEVVTWWQKILQFTNMCKTAQSRYDINHYCSICGCYIGRYTDIGCYQKCLAKRARRLAANDAMTVRPQRKDCWQRLNESRQRISDNMVKDREERRRKQMASATEGEVKVGGK